MTKEVTLYVKPNVAPDHSTVKRSQPANQELDELGSVSIHHIR
jgi:hypothetical protein